MKFVSYLFLAYTAAIALSPVDSAFCNPTVSAVTFLAGFDGNDTFSPQTGIIMFRPWGYVLSDNTSHMRGAGVYQWCQPVFVDSFTSGGVVTADFANPNYSYCMQYQDDRIHMTFTLDKLTFSGPIDSSIGQIAGVVTLTNTKRRIDLPQWPRRIAVRLLFASHSEVRQDILKYPVPAVI